MTVPPRYTRVMLKLSGEALMGEAAYGIDVATIKRIAAEIRAVHGDGVQLCVVVGGGNIFRGIVSPQYGMDRAAADSMGMLATVINTLALQGVLEAAGLECRVQSALAIPSVCEPFDRRRAIRHLESGRIVLFGAGTGNPFFTTDTAAALRAIETRCDVMLKGTQVDGVYSADPKKDPTARRYETLSYQDVLTQNLSVMDGTAVALARDNRLPVIVFSIHEPGNLARVINGVGKYTLVH